MFGVSTKELLKVSEKCLDSQLWHACAGGMAQMPSVSSKVYYFPQGHVEHCTTNVDFGSTRLHPCVLCHVASVKFLADHETDEVFAKVQLIPIGEHELDFGNADDPLTLNFNSQELAEKPASFAKRLTQSDANNGGGFSVPRYCAETIFPRLDYSAEPPVQTVLAKDVHGEIWKFRHIYRGTPRRHLLTTGWSTFVNQKKLVAGDSIVFVRTENGELCVGIRRAKREMGNGPNTISGWNPPTKGNYGSTYGGFPMFLREEEIKLMRGNDNNFISSGRFANAKGKGRVKAESVIEAATLAANGQSFQIVYYPRASTPEYCVKAASVRAAMKIRWCLGMRFKIPFETDDSSRISWFMGTISSVQAADPLRWPNSPWRLLEVTWDEPDLLQNVKRVSPWLVEFVSNKPSIHWTPFSPSRKKLCCPPNSEFTPNVHFPNPNIFQQNHPFGIQGARHSPFGGTISLPNVQLNKLHPGLFPTTFHQFISKPTIQNDISCLLTIGTPTQNLKRPCNGKTHQFLLFGQPILTEEQISLNNPEILGVGNGHCKVFMELEDVGQTLDLSLLCSYEDLYEKLSDMLDIEESRMRNLMVYYDSFGAVKCVGEGPFSEFKQTARKLTVLKR